MSQRCSCDLCCPGTVSQFHGEDADWQAVLADEREMDRDMMESYNRHHIGGPQYILTQVRQLAERAERAGKSDAPRRNVPWRRG